MALKEVTKAPTRAQINELKREYKSLCKKYDDKKYQFRSSLNANDFNSLSIEAFLELKELHIRTKKLYWKIHELEHPEDHATREAYKFLDTMTEDGKIDWLVSHHLSTIDLIDEIKKNPNFITEVTA